MSDNEHVAALLSLPVADRAKAARTLLESLDAEDAGDDTRPTVAEAQQAELVRRMQALDKGTVSLVGHDEARARVRARLQAIRGQ